MSKRALQINVYVLSLTPIVENNSREGRISKNAIGFLHQQNYRDAYVLSLIPVVERNTKEGSSSKKASGFFRIHKFTIGGAVSRKLPSNA